MQPDPPNPGDPEQVPHRKARRSRHRCPNGEVAITYRILVIGYGGWTLHAEDLEKGHYGDTWVLYVGEMADDIIGVDLTAIPRTDPRLSRLALDGPMVKVGVPAGTLDTCHGPETFVDNGDLGNARALHYVDPSTYAMLAKRFGARTFDPRKTARLITQDTTCDQCPTHRPQPKQRLER